jgi:hypothetical protein
VNEPKLFTRFWTRIIGWKPPRKLNTERFSLVCQTLFSFHGTSKSHGSVVYGYRAGAIVCHLPIVSNYSEASSPVCGLWAETLNKIALAGIFHQAYGILHPGRGLTSESGADRGCSWLCLRITVRKNIDFEEQSNATARCIETAELFSSFLGNASSIHADDARGAGADW